MIEFLFPRHASPPLHTHPQDESYVVQEGRLTVQAGAQRFELVPGAVAVVPMGVVHTFRVDSDAARVLVLSTPAGLERLTGTRRLGTGVDADIAAERHTTAFASGAGSHLPRSRQVNVGSPLAPGD